MDDDADWILLGPADTITVDYDSTLQMSMIRIQSQTWDEPPRWLGCVVDSPGDTRHIDELIAALHALRTTQQLAAAPL